MRDADTLQLYFGSIRKPYGTISFDQLSDQMDHGDSLVIDLVQPGTTHFQTTAQRRGDAADQPPGYCLQPALIIANDGRKYCPGNRPVNERACHGGFAGTRGSTDQDATISNNNCRCMHKLTSTIDHQTSTGRMAVKRAPR